MLSQPPGLPLCCLPCVQLCWPASEQSIHYPHHYHRSSVWPCLLDNFIHIYLFKSILSILLLVRQPCIVKYPATQTVENEARIFTDAYIRHKIFLFNYICVVDAFVSVCIKMYSWKMVFKMSPHPYYCCPFCLSDWTFKLITKS